MVISWRVAARLLWVRFLLSSLFFIYLLWYILRISFFYMYINKVLFFFHKNRFFYIHSHIFFSRLNSNIQRHFDHVVNDVKQPVFSGFFFRYMLDSYFLYYRSLYLKNVFLSFDEDIQVRLFYIFHSELLKLSFFFRRNSEKYTLFSFFIRTYFYSDDKKKVFSIRFLNLYEKSIIDINKLVFDGRLLFINKMRTLGYKKNKISYADSLYSFQRKYFFRKYDSNLNKLKKRSVYLLNNRFKKRIFSSNNKPSFFSFQSKYRKFKSSFLLSSLFLFFIQNVHFRSFNNVLFSILNNKKHINFFLLFSSYIRSFFQSLSIGDFRRLNFSSKNARKFYICFFLIFSRFFFKHKLNKSNKFSHLKSSVFFKYLSNSYTYNFLSPYLYNSHKNNIQYVPMWNKHKLTLFSRFFLKNYLSTFFSYNKSICLIHKNTDYLSSYMIYDIFNSKFNTNIISKKKKRTFSVLFSFLSNFFFKPFLFRNAINDYNYKLTDLRFSFLNSSLNRFNSNFLFSISMNDFFFRISNVISNNKFLNLKYLFTNISIDSVSFFYSFIFIFNNSNLYFSNSVYNELIPTRTVSSFLFFFLHSFSISFLFFFFLLFNFSSHSNLCFSSSISFFFSHHSDPFFFFRNLFFIFSIFSGIYMPIFFSRLRIFYSSIKSFVFPYLYSKSFFFISSYNNVCIYNPFFFSIFFDSFYIRSSFFSVYPFFSSFFSKFFFSSFSHYSNSYICSYSSRKNVTFFFSDRFFYLEKFLFFRRLLLNKSDFNFHTHFSNRCFLSIDSFVLKSRLFFRIIKFFKLNRKYFSRSRRSSQMKWYNV